VPRWLVLPLVAAAVVAEAGPKPRYPLPKLPSLRAMTRAAATDQPPLAANCFAYAAKSHAFACVGHDPIYNMNNIGADDQATNIRIDVVGPDQQSSWTIAAIGKRPTTPRATVESKLGELGLRALTTAPIKIASNTWVAIGAVQLFLRVDAHEGDASFENFGDLTLRCTKTQDVVIDLRAVGIELGDTAVAYRSPDGNWLALTISGLDGGEDTYDYNLDTVVLDLATTCAHRSPAMWTTIRRPDGG
jgi:hypothetical protein